MLPDVVDEIAEHRLQTLHIDRCQDRPIGRLRPQVESFAAIALDQGRQSLAEVGTLVTPSPSHVGASKVEEAADETMQPVDVALQVVEETAPLADRHFG